MNDVLLLNLDYRFLNYAFYKNKIYIVTLLCIYAN